MLKLLPSGQKIDFKVVHRKSIISQANGLMFTRPIKDEAHIFYLPKGFSGSFHMFFVFYPIDIIFLNKDKKIVDFKEEFKPFSMYTSKKRASYAVELPSGTISRFKIDKETSIDWDNI